MKKILMLSSRLPYPPIGGDRLKNYNLIKILSKHYSIHLVALTNQKLTEEQLLFCNTYCETFKIFKKSKFQSVFNVLKFFFNGKPLQVNYYYFNDVQKYIDQESKNVDLIVNTLIRTSEYVLMFDKPKFLDMVDSISINYERSYQKVKSFIWKLIYQYEIKLLKKYEKKCIEKYENTFFVNYNEAEYWSKFGKTTWIPNGVNEKLFSYNKTKSEYQNHVAFFGKMDYQPNIDAVIWFIENVLPKLHQNIKFIVVGISPTEKIRSYKGDRVQITGYIEDPYEILNSSLCNIAPMQTGGGMQNKVLETMALGTINVVSTLGSEPIIGAIDGTHLLISDNSKHMGNLINDIYQNRSKYEFLKGNSKKLINSNYTWENYENILIKMIHSNY